MVECLNCVGMNYGCVDRDAMGMGSQVMVTLYSDHEMTLVIVSFTWVTTLPSSLESEG